MFLIDIIVFLLALGLLIFVHELGHFVAAKACGVYVARFSLGMPPRVFGFTFGETDYCISALPLGGYVKMAGQEDAPLTEEERESEYGHVPPERWLNNKPIWQRFIVFVAGPLMNLVLAVVLYGLVAATGAEVHETQLDNRIGAIEPDSPAANASMYLMPAPTIRPDTAGTPDATGWQTADRITHISGTEITNIIEAGMSAALGGDEVLDVIIERISSDGAVHTYLSPVQPQKLDEDGMARFGITAFETTLVGAVTEGRPAAQQGIQQNDIITKANGQWVDQGTFIALTEQMPEGDSMELELLRVDEYLRVSVQPQTEGRFVDIKFARADDSEDPPAFVASISKEVSEATGLLLGDVVLALNDNPVTQTALHAYELKHPGEQVSLAIRRPALLFGLKRSETQETITLDIDSVRAIGIALIPKMVFYRTPPLQVIPQAFGNAYMDLERTIKTFQKLATGAVSPKNLGGPVLIYQATTRAAQAGYWWIVRMMAFISVNLCVFNLLPLPVLDGGQVMLLGIEGLRRKPPSMKAVERFQQVGLVLVIALMLFVTYNDILRWLKNMVP